MRPRRLAALSLAAAAAAGCIPSSVVAPDQRTVLLDSELVAWRPATPEDVPGLYSSAEISGPMAGALWQVHYLFEASGAYTGAALLAGSPPRFEVLSGRWAFGEGCLQLDDAEPARLEAGPGRLRLRGEEGSVVLVRGEL